jgi:hypothetical protein
MTFGGSSAWSRVVASGILVAGVLVAAPFVRGRAQDAPAPQEPLPPMMMLEERVKQLEQMVAQQQKELDQLYRVADGLYAGANHLAVAADQARELGFEWAGANPAAHTEVLEGLWAFQAALAHATAPPEKTAEETAKKK